MTSKIRAMQQSSSWLRPGFFEPLNNVAMTLYELTQFKGCLFQRF
ncbi:hypothetical protein [Rickettsia endosymbiont of Polydrusus tereticollis]